MAEERGRLKYRLTVKLDMEWDADVIAWLEVFPKGQRSTTVRDALRQTMQDTKYTDLEAIREVVADELAKALVGKALSLNLPVEQTQLHDAEEKFGSKLDQMLGGLIRGKDNSEDNHEP